MRSLEFPQSEADAAEEQDLAGKAATEVGEASPAALAATETFCSATPVDGSVEASAAAKQATVAKKSPYLPPAAQPAQAAAEGIRFDFNDGCRVRLPPLKQGRWRVQLRDLDTDNVIYATENKGAFINSSKRWYIRFRIDVWAIGEENSEEPPRSVLSHQYDLDGREVLIRSARWATPSGGSPTPSDLRTSTPPAR